MAWSVAVGYFSCFICALFFGSMFVPLKRLNTGDGVFVQFIMGIAICCCGLIVGVYNNYQNFYPLSMLGGFLWSTGNITAIPIINRIGMTIGILLWSFTGLLSGWASSRFGWFGMKPQKPSSDLLNYSGLILSLISALMFAFIENVPEKNGDRQVSRENSDDNEDMSVNHRETSRRSQSSINSGDDDDVENLLGSDNVAVIHENDGSYRKAVLRISSTLYLHHERLIALFTAILAGIFYGLCFAPVIYIQDNYPNAPQEALCYVFAFTVGVMASCTFYFVIYTAYKGNRPYIDPNLCLPAFLAGVFWAVAQTAFFVANESLSEAVSFPIISRLPGLVAALWGVFYFKEIQGKKNLAVLAAAMFVTVIGGILCGLSR